MLALNRVSMTPLSDLSSLVQNPRREATSNLQKTTVMLMESEGYLAFSKETPDEEIKRWQAALDALKSTGRYDELMRTYLWTE